MRFSIRVKLFLIISTVVVTMTVFAVYHFFEMLEHNKDDIKSRNLDIAQEISRGIDNLIDKSYGILQALSKHPAVIKKDSKECDRLFAELLAHYPLYLDIVAAGIDGYNYGSGVYSPNLRSLNYNDKEWFINSKGGAPIVSDLYISKSNIPSVMIAASVFDNKGKQIGILGLPLDLSKMENEIVKTWRLSDKSTIIIIDSKLDVILCRLRKEMSGKQIIGFDFLKKDPTKKQGSGEDLGIDNIKRLYSFSSLSNANWKVIVGVPTKEAYMPAYSMGQHYMTVLFSGAAIAIVLSLLVSKRITKNISSLKKGLKEIEQGNLYFDLRLSGHDELQDVAESFNRMVKERKKTEEDLRKSESFLSSVLEGIGEGVVVIDRDLTIISANKGYCEQVKMSCADIIGRRCYEVSHHSKEPCYEKNNGCECAVKQCFETGEHYMTIHPHYDKAENQIFIEVNAYPLKDSHGIVIAAIETLEDVTDKLRFEKRLEEVKEQYRKLYDDAPDMMHSVDRNGIIIVCNRTEAETLGYAVDEIVGKALRNIIAPESRQNFDEKFEFLKNTGSLEGEMVFITKDERRIPVFIKAKAIYDDKGTFLMCDAIARNITEKKTLEAQLMQAQKMEAVGQLAGGVAHDFNNILTAITGYSNLLQMKMEAHDPLRVYVNQILSASERASNLTHSLLAFSRKQVINLRPVNLNEIIKSIEKLLSRLIGEDIEFKTILSDKELIVMADISQIEQVLMNFATNARDAMPDGGLLVIETGNVEFDEGYVRTLGFGKTGRYAFFSVSDSGTGMEEKIKERIFEPFFTTKELGKGSGLGLAMVYGIIKQHSGYINVYSEPGKGTTFKIFLPLLSAKPGTEDKELIPESKIHIPKASDGETILIAEDDPATRAVIKNILEEFGYSVIETADGEDAIRKFAANKDRIKLTILDVIMPKINGRESCEEIKKINPDAKVIFMSGYTADIIMEDSITTNNINLLYKPVTTASLLQIVQETLSS